MSGKTKTAATLMLLALLPGCVTYSLEELRHTTPRGTAFQNALSRLYLDFASQEEKDYDWFTSMHFADKGLQAAYGKDVAPEQTKDWDLPEEKRPEFEKAREKLVTALTPEAVKAHPDDAARAQYNFDCWVEQQEENWQQDDIARCRDGMEDALAALQSPAKPRMHTYAKKAASPKQKHVTAKKKPACPEPAVPVMADTAAYMVFFAPSSVDLTEAGAKTIDDAAASLKGKPNYHLVIHGNGKGGKDSLTAGRMEAVKKRLVAGGVAPAAISESAGKPPEKRVDIYLDEFKP